MSDLYLVLRRRLEDVTDWVELGTPTLKTARKAKGFSYEAMGRQLGVAAKTWERWEKAGHVPRHNLERIASILDLEIDWPRRGKLSVQEPEDPVRQAVREEMAEVYEVLERIEARLSRAERQSG